MTAFPTITADTPVNDAEILDAIVTDLDERWRAVGAPDYQYPGTWMSVSPRYAWFKWPLDPADTVSGTYDEETDSTPVNAPQHLAKGNLIVPVLRDKLFAGIEIQYMSKRKTLADHHTDAICITNLTLFSQKLIKGLEISGTLYNLFNKKYGDPGSEEHVQDQIKQDGRTFRIKVTYEF